MKDMLGRGEAIGVKDALGLIASGLAGFPQRLEKERIGLEDSYGRVLSEDISSPEDLPCFTRGTVDGFAVFSGDTFGLPAYLDVTHEIPMGREPGFALKRGEAAKIPTGGALPIGADAVLMLEHAQEIDGRMIEAQRRLAPGENVIARGEDAKKGDAALKAGMRLRPQDVALLAGLGIKDVSVYHRPRVSIISTGDEIVPHESHLSDGGHKPLSPGLVRDANSIALAGLVREAGGVALRRGIFRDRYDEIRGAIDESLKDSQMALITGGSSVGARDMVARTIGDAGSLLFHGVSMKPGKPLMAGFIGGIPVFGLPGHPAAVALCFGVFVRPALRLISGITEDGFSGRANTVAARLTRGVRSVAGRQDYIRVSLREEGGLVLATPVLGKSGLISTLINAHGVVEVPPERLGLDENEQVEVRLF